MYVANGSANPVQRNLFEKIGVLQIGWHVHNLEFPPLHMLTDKVVSDVDVLRVRSGGGVDRQVYCSLVILEDCRAPHLFVRKGKTPDIPQKNHLLQSLRQRRVLSLGGRRGHALLRLRKVSHTRTRTHQKPPRHRFAARLLAGKVYVDIQHQTEVPTPLKCNPEIKSPSYIHQIMQSGLPVSSEVPRPCTRRSVSRLASTQPGLRARCIARGVVDAPTGGVDSDSDGTYGSRRIRLSPVEPLLVIDAVRGDGSGSGASNSCGGKASGGSRGSGGRGGGGASGGSGDGGDRGGDKGRGGSGARGGRGAGGRRVADMPATGAGTVVVAVAVMLAAGARMVAVSAAVMSAVLPAALVPGAGELAATAVVAPAEAVLVVDAAAEAVAPLAAPATTS